MRTEKIRIAGIVSLALCLCLFWGCSNTPVKQLTVRGGEDSLLAQWDEYRRVMRLKDKKCALTDFSMEVDRQGRVVNLTMGFCTPDEIEHVMTFPGQRNAVHINDQPTPPNEKYRLTVSVQVRSFLEALEKLADQGYLPEGFEKSDRLAFTMAGWLRVKGRPHWVEAESTMEIKLFDGVVLALENFEPITNLDAPLPFDVLPILVQRYDTIQKEEQKGTVILLPAEAVNTEGLWDERKLYNSNN